MSKNYLTLEEGNYIVLLNDIKLGDMMIHKGTTGKIINANRQAIVDVWFSSVFVRSINSQNYRGSVIEVERKDIAVKYEYDLHNEIKIKITDALTIPYVTEETLLALEQHKLTIEQNKYSKLKNTIYTDDKYVSLSTIIDIIENNFSDYTYTLNFVEDTDSCYDVVSVLDDESNTKYQQKQNEIGAKFAEVTHVAYEFLGGLHSIYD